MYYSLLFILSTERHLDYLKDMTMIINIHVKGFMWILLINPLAHRFFLSNYLFLL